MPEAIAKKPKTRTVHGTLPSHVHRDPDSNEQWQCNSPYCTDIEAVHPDNGGPGPVVMGYEPWRR